MASCDSCGSTILFGGQQVGSYRFCNQQCAAKGTLLQFADQIPADLVQRQVWSLHNSNCPVCGGSGPVDVHTSYRVYSVILMTSWQNLPRVSCRSCGVKAKLTDGAISLVAGWWGFPWGFIMTPIQLGRNIIGLIKGPDSTGPSPQLEKTVRTMIASQLAQQSQGRPNV